MLLSPNFSDIHFQFSPVSESQTLQPTEDYKKKHAHLFKTAAQVEAEGMAFFLRYVMYSYIAFAAAHSASDLSWSAIIDRMMLGPTGLLVSETIRYA